MPIIQNEKERLLAHSYTAENICDENCDACAKDKRIYDGLINTRNPHILRNVCPVGLGYGKRIENYGKNNSSEYSSFIISIARSIQMDSFGDIIPEKIKSDIRDSRKYLKGEIPTVVDETFDIPSDTISQIVHISPKITKLFSKKLVGLF